MERILIIDDEEGIRFTFAKFLTAEGYRVQTAADFAEGRAQIAAGGWDLIFLDLVLKDQKGLDLLAAIKESELLCQVIVITGYPDLDTATEALRLGAFDYIVKPVRKQTLLRITDIALKHQRLVQEKERFRTNLEAIFRSVKDGIIAVDNDLTLTDLNEAARQLCGLEGDPVGSPLAALPLPCHKTCLQALEETLKKQQPVEASRIECRGEERPGQVVSVTATPLHAAQRGFSGAVLVIRDETQLATLERNLKARRNYQQIVGSSEEMQRIYDLIEDLRDVQTTVLISGESGTGKELVAEALHYSGERAEQPLVKVNCSALPESLLESELFGHVKGAFTGAVRDKIGRFQRAAGGTIFLDEIGDISSNIQLRLLRVLQEKEFERVGDSKPIQVDVRIVTATNQELREKVSRGEFREDLYYRLRVVEITLPPLKKRRKDIPLLVDHFIQKFNQQFNKEILAVSTDVINLFMDYPWPGNIRELEHAIEHAFVLCKQSIISVKELPPEFKELAAGDSAPEQTAEDECLAIRRALETCYWNKAEAARLLGVSRQTIYRKIHAYQLSRDDGAG